MSQITAETIQKIAKLARIKTSKSEEKQLTKQLGDIICWVEKLNEVNTDDTDILTNCHNINMPLFPDKVLYGDLTEEVLENAPNTKYNYFTVPKVIDNLKTKGS